MNQENTYELKPDSGYMVIDSNLLPDNQEELDSMIKYWFKNSEFLTLYDLRVKFFHSLEVIEIERLLNSLTKYGGVKLERKKVDGERLFRLEVSEDSVFRNENYIQRFSGNLTKDELSAIVNKAQENANRDSKQFIINQIEKEILPLYTPSEYIEVLKNERNKYLEILNRHYYQINYPKEMIEYLHDMSRMKRKIRVEYGVIFLGKVTEELALLSGLQNAYYYKIFVDSLNDKINQLEKPVLNIPPSFKTFNLDLTDVQKDKLCELLEKEGFIAKTNRELFRRIFSEVEVLDLGGEKIEWLGKHRQEVSPKQVFVFLGLLQEKIDGLSIEKTPGHESRVQSDKLYDRVNECFYYYRDKKRQKITSSHNRYYTNEKLEQIIKVVLKMPIKPQQESSSHDVSF